MINFNFHKYLSSEYKKNSPFPHIIIDDLFPHFLLESIYEEISLSNKWTSDFVEWTQKYQINKFYWPHDFNSAENLNVDLPKTYTLLKYLNSSEFVSYLSELTGIPNLIGDNHFFGGGLHKIDRGGKLDLHRDYNVHPEKPLYRRLNLLIYLNPTWDQEWGGNLELWDPNITKCEKSVEPHFNRSVIFTISDNSIHGHPEPLNCPQNVSRYSLALYYFTEENPMDTNDHPVVFFSK
jgi:Rps23 Pro-64 3,4-dihydroxylase Tpa1-like proline 4-hydroxylase